MPIHVAITRQVRAGCETEFQQALREFFKTSFAHGGVWGASMLTPPPGSDSREFGILRTFANESERDAFYNSQMFKKWDEHARRLTEGEPVYRQLTGLEAWFRSPQNPPRWKMALLTWLAVWPVSMIVSSAIKVALPGTLPKALFSGIAALGIVIVLTWIAMPLLVKFTRNWLRPPVSAK
jgi:antibiotic biosynthesis monooxygenase (ABM) superfamily enzyme